MGCPWRVAVTLMQKESVSELSASGIAIGRAVPVQLTPLAGVCVFQFENWLAKLPK